MPGSEGDPNDPVLEEDMADLGEVEDKTYTPPHMEGREIIRAGVMLPFSDRRSSVRDQAQSMLAAIEMALFDAGGDNVVLLPKDTGGSQAIATEKADELIAQGADFVLGPLYGGNVTAARDAFALGGKPVIAFSNDNTVAGGGVWLASISPEAQVTDIINYASQRGYDQFAFFGPQNSIGERVARAMQFEVARNGGQMISTGFYPSGSETPTTEAEYFAKSVAQAADAGGRVAVLVPERGTRLRRIAPLLAYHGVDTRQVKMLGITTWNDPGVWREPSLKGAWFPAEPEIDMAGFVADYSRQYGREPSSLAPVAYDAAALAFALSADGELTTDELTTREGFAGVNGLFRFRYDGVAERSLAIMEIDPNSETGVREVRPVASSFDATIG